LAGVFIVYNTSATAITQRARDLAIVIALGAERRTIFALVLVESMIIGVIASVIGIACGYALAHVLLSLVANSMGEVYQARFSVESLSLTWQQALWYAGLGTIGTVAAALRSGAERLTIFALVLVESMLLGVIASVIGIACGYALAHVLLSLVANSMGVVYQARFSVESLSLTWQQALWYAGLGTIGTVAAAL